MIPYNTLLEIITCAQKLAGARLVYHMGVEPRNKKKRLMCSHYLVKIKYHIIYTFIKYSLWPTLRNVGKRWRAQQSSIANVDFENYDCIRWATVAAVRIGHDI